MSFYGPSKTWKIIYSPVEQNGGMVGVAFVEAPDKHAALYTFREQYTGQYRTVESCVELFKQ